MDDQFMIDNLYLFIGLFATVCVVILVLLIVSGRKQKQKKKDMLASDANLVEVAFDYPALPKERVIMNPGQTEFVIHSVNGKQAELIKNAIIVPSGTLELDVQYYQKMGTSKIAKSLARATNIFTIESGKKYIITYNLLDKVFECKETKKK